MNTYRHSVYLDEQKCDGCSSCLRHCPTEAIRIRNRKASIDMNRCIDCGECIRVCPQKAKKAACGSLEQMKNYRYTVALPAPSLYGQFDNLEDINCVLMGLKRIGFDDVVEVAAAAELVSAYTRLYLKEHEVKKPVISSACPAILRLIGLRFPTLNDHILPMLPPMEIAAKAAREKAKKEHPELMDSDIGIFFLSPCPAKASYVSNGFADYRSEVDVVVPASDVYFRLIHAMKREDSAESLSGSGVIGISWASSGGEATAIFSDSYLAADGIDHCIHVLDQIENGSIPKLEFVELNACTGGCVGGVLNIQNPFVAKARLRTLRRYLPVSQNFIDSRTTHDVPSDYLFRELPAYRPISVLSNNMTESLRMMSEIVRLRSRLPGVDCGFCGAPNCRAFAEDVVRKKCSQTDCPLAGLYGSAEPEKGGGEVDGS